MEKEFKITKRNIEILKELKNIFIINNIESKSLRFVDTELDITMDMLNNYDRIDKIETLKKCTLNKSIDNFIDTINPIRVSIGMLPDNESFDVCKNCRIRHECPIKYYLMDIQNLNIIIDYRQEYIKYQDNIKKYTNNKILNDVTRLLESRKDETIELLNEVNIKKSTYEKVIEVIFRPNS